MPWFSMTADCFLFWFRWWHNNWLLCDWIIAIMTDIMNYNIAILVKCLCNNVDFHSFKDFKSLKDFHRFITLISNQFLVRLQEWLVILILKSNCHWWFWFWIEIIIGMILSNTGCWKGCRFHSEYGSRVTQRIFEI